MKISDIETMEKDMLVPTDIASILGCDPHKIRCQARANPTKLGFPVIVLGNRVKIPRIAFINYCKGIEHKPDAVSGEKEILQSVIDYLADKP